MRSIGLFSTNADKFLDGSFEQPSVLHERVEQSDDTRSEHTISVVQGRPMPGRGADGNYACMHNLQRDIAGLVDMNGTLMVQYGYDALGKLIYTEGIMAGTPGYDNPFRCMGYARDDETGLYSLGSRYYDPCRGRLSMRMRCCVIGE